MSKSNAFETAILALIANGTGIPDLADNDATSPAASLYLALHTADPGEAGTQATSEAAYTGYARKAVARNSGALLVSGNTLSLVADQDFPECTASPGSPLTHWSIGSIASGASLMLCKGALASSITMGVGVIPRVKAGTLVTED
jgi:hypothetical protein